VVSEEMWIVDHVVLLGVTSLGIVQGHAFVMGDVSAVGPACTVGAVEPRPRRR